jgi:hypothetical protein
MSVGVQRPSAGGRRKRRRKEEEEGRARAKKLGAKAA